MKYRIVFFSLLVLLSTVSPIRGAQLQSLPDALSNADALQITQMDVGETRHKVGSKFASAIAVKVTDERKRVVPEANVVFQISGSGAGATVGDADTFITRTDQNGVATLKAVRANRTAGRYWIFVTAKFEGKSGRTKIEEENIPPRMLQRRSTQLAGVAAVAVIVPILTLRSSPPPKATISTVTPTAPVGQP